MIDTGKIRLMIFLKGLLILYREMLLVKKYKKYVKILPHITNTLEKKKQINKLQQALNIHMIKWVEESSCLVFLLSNGLMKLPHNMNVITYFMFTGTPCQDWTAGCHQSHGRHRGKAKQYFVYAIIFSTEALLVGCFKRIHDFYALILHSLDNK